MRNPSSICGCIGYKPTYGLVSRYGLIPLNNYFDTVGIMARSVDTIVDVLSNLNELFRFFSDLSSLSFSFFVVCIHKDEIAGPDPKDATTIKNEFQRIDLKKTNRSFERIRFGIPQVTDLFKHLNHENFANERGR